MRKRVKILILIIILSILIISGIRKIYLLNKIYLINTDLQKIEDYYYELNNKEIFMKKAGIIKKHNKEENKTIYIDLSENEQYVFFENERKVRKMEISKENVYTSLVKIDNEVLKDLKKILNIKIKNDENFYFLVIDSFEYKINKNTGLIEMITDLNTGEKDIYTNYKLGEEIQDIEIPDIENYIIE